MWHLPWCRNKKRFLTLRQYGRTEHKSHTRTKQTKKSILLRDEPIELQNNKHFIVNSLRRTLYDDSSSFSVRTTTTDNGKMRVPWSSSPYVPRYSTTVPHTDILYTWSFYLYCSPASVCNVPETTWRKRQVSVTRSSPHAVKFTSNVLSGHDRIHCVLQTR